MGIMLGLIVGVLLMGHRATSSGIMPGWAQAVAGAVAGFDIGIVAALLAESCPSIILGSALGSTLPGAGPHRRESPQD
jgi:hypothetical protein